jgi:hypothetical protein
MVFKIRLWYPAGIIWTIVHGNFNFGYGSFKISSHHFNHPIHNLKLYSQFWLYEWYIYENVSAPRQLIRCADRKSNNCHRGMQYLTEKRKNMFSCSNHFLAYKFSLNGLAIHFSMKDSWFLKPVCSLRLEFDWVIIPVTGAKNIPKD